MRRGTKPPMDGCIGSLRPLTTQPGSSLLASRLTNFRQRGSWHSRLSRDTDERQSVSHQACVRRPTRAGLAAIQNRLADTQNRVVLCGHSHQQHFIQLSDGPTILNPGSVGCPSYDDPGNDPHLSEVGSPHARYAVLEINENQVSAEMVAITYDWNAAVARAERNGRPDWANGLRTGWFIAGTRAS